MRRNLLVASLLLVVAIGSFVRVTHHKSGWGGYWEIELAAPRRR